MGQKGSIGESNNHCFDLSRLNDDSIIVDAGACQGSTAIGLRSCPETAKCKIVMVECNKTNIEWIKKLDLGDAPLVEMALCGEDIPDEVEFIEYYSKSNDYRGWGNIEKKHVNKFRGTYVVEVYRYNVQTIKMNRLFRLLGVDKIDFLKMDIEGSEKNLFDTISKHSLSMIDQISLELHNRKWFNDINDKLKTAGFNVFDLVKWDEIYATRNHKLKLGDIPYK